MKRMNLFKCNIPSEISFFYSCSCWNQKNYLLIKIIQCQLFVENGVFGYSMQISRMAKRIPFSVIFATGRVIYSNFLWVNAMKKKGRQKTSTTTPSRPYEAIENCDEINMNNVHKFMNQQINKTSECESIALQRARRQFAYNLFSITHRQTAHTTPNISYTVYAIVPTIHFQIVYHDHSIPCKWHYSNYGFRLPLLLVPKLFVSFVGLKYMHGICMRCSR